jgi:glycerol-3-phosphate dehydrogenase
LTTFRAFAEQVTDKVLTTLGANAAPPPKTPIGGGKDYPRNNDERERTQA